VGAVDLGFSQHFRSHPVPDDLGIIHQGKHRDVTIRDGQFFKNFGNVSKHGRLNQFAE
jgi:hypothetical protein